MGYVVHIVTAIGVGIVILYGCLGEILTEKSGHLNLGIPGIMCMGTAGGCLGVSVYMKSLMAGTEPSGFLLLSFSVILAALFACIGGIIYAFLTVSLRCNQNVTGLAITTFGSGFSEYIMGIVKKDEGTIFAVAKLKFKSSLPFADSLGVFGKVFLSHGFLVYFAIALAILMWFILKKTRIGLNLCAVGENPATADAAGINVTAYKYAAILIGSAIAGIGGLFYVMDSNDGSWETASTLLAYGWLAIALVIFAIWKPNIAIFGSILFGVLYVLKGVLGLDGAPSKIVMIFPYLITVIVLILTSVFDSKNAQPPASLGLNYFREDR
ncbi:MAG: ABC transporter permease [Clostridia bacterium]|nr:ABC transporter permease [Clostridia bacterium]